MPAKRKARKTKKQIAAEKLYREKYNLIQKINKRIRDTVNKIGVANEIVQNFEVSLTLDGRVATEVYSKEGARYHLLSRSKEAVEKMSLEDLEQLASATPQWKTTKEELTRALNADRKPGEQYTRANPPTLDELRNQASLTRKIHKMLEDNSELFYMLLDKMQRGEAGDDEDAIYNGLGWDIVQDRSTEEIYQELKKIQDYLDAGNKWDWSQPYDLIGKQYSERYQESKRRKAAALKKARS